MEQKSMTALVSAFARAYHTQNCSVRIFDDRIAGKLLSDEEYGQIAKSMADGIAFFNPSLADAPPEDALRWIVDNQLSPSPLGRAAFAEQALRKAVSGGAGQYLILGAGYDTFAYRQPAWAADLQIFEIDLPAAAEDKKMRLQRAGIAVPDNVHYIPADFSQSRWQQALTQHRLFDENKTSFCGLLGVSYYLSRRTFEGLVSALSELLPKGSSLVFDYPDQNSSDGKTGGRAQKQAALAKAAEEEMQTGFSYQDLEKLLFSHGFFICGHLLPAAVTKQYFGGYNRANPLRPITALEQVNYCLAVRK